MIILYLGIAFCLSRIEVNSKANSAHEVGIYILSNGVHTDIVVPVNSEEMNWSKSIPFKNTKANDSTANFLALGWGDRGFYLETPTWADLKASTALKATLGLSRSAIHATYYKNLTENDHCKKIYISKSEYLDLIEYINRSFMLDETGNPIMIRTEANYGKNDAFYEAKGSYNLFYTCNTWTNNSLKACNQKACFWTPFDTGIFFHYK